MSIEVQAKGIGNIFNKIIAQNLTNFEKQLSICYRRLLGHQTDMVKIQPFHGIL
jgi:hypothetical protein